MPTNRLIVQRGKGCNLCIRPAGCRVWRPAVRMRCWRFATKPSPHYPALCVRTWISLAALSRPALIRPSRGTSLAQQRVRAGCIPVLIDVLAVHGRARATPRCCPRVLGELRRAGARRKLNLSPWWTLRPAVPLDDAPATRLLRKKAEADSGHEGRPARERRQVPDRAAF